jgi:hypothetical protein
MTVVFKPVTLGAARRKRQYRIEPVERLNRRLFIHAEHCRVPWRIQVQTDDVGGFRFEIRIVAGQVKLDPMRFQARFFPHPVHHIFADAQMGREFAATPVRRSVGWLFPSGGQNPGVQGGRQNARRLAGMIRVQSVDAT